MFPHKPFTQLTPNSCYDWLSFFYRATGGRPEMRFKTSQYIRRFVYNIRGQQCNIDWKIYSQEQFIKSHLTLVRDSGELNNLADKGTG